MALSKLDSGIYVDKCQVSREKKDSLQAITASQRGKVWSLKGPSLQQLTKSLDLKIGSEQLDYEQCL